MPLSKKLAAKKKQGRKEKLIKRKGLKLKPDKISPPLSESFKRVTRSRNYQNYSKISLTDFSVFRGKRVLDVGCGDGVFVQEARERGILAEGIDPTFTGKNPNIKNLNLNEFKSKQKYDCVISIYGLPYYSSNTFNARLAVYQMLKLVKPGGTLIVYPVTFPNKSFSANPYQARAPRVPSGVTLSMIRKLRAEGFEIQIKKRSKSLQATLIVRKKNEPQTKKLGERLGVIN